MEDGNHGDQSHHSVGARRALARKTYGAAEVEMEGQREKMLIEQLFCDAARLRATRKPGKEGRLSVDEAIAARREQFETFDWWLGSGLPLGEIRAWVEGREVMGAGALPQSPAKLKTFTFVMPSREPEVLQLTTWADGRLVVLYTLPLRDVPAGGLKRTLAWRNGQSLLFKINREANGELSVEVILNPHRVGESTGEEKPRVRRAVSNATAEAEPATDEPATDEPTPKAKAAGMRRTLFVRGWELLAVLLFRPSARKLRYAAAALAFALVLIPLSNLRGEKFMTNSSPRSAETLDPRAVSGENPPARTPDAADTQTPPAGGSPDESADARTESAAVDTTPAPAAPASKGVVKGVGTKKPERTPEDVLPDDTATADGRILKAVYGEPGQSERLGEGDAGWESTAGASSPGADKFAKLARMRNLYIELDRTRPNPSADLDELHEAMVRALEASERFMVLGETDRQRADAVISLRFWEPDENRQGAIYADVRDLSGKLLWDDLVGCSDLLNDSQNVALDDASMRLVNKLKEVVGLAQQSNKHTE